MVGAVVGSCEEACATTSKSGTGTTTGGSKAGAGAGTGAGAGAGARGSGLRAREEAVNAGGGKPIDDSAAGGAIETASILIAAFAAVPFPLGFPALSFPALDFTAEPFLTALELSLLAVAEDILNNGFKPVMTASLIFPSIVVGPADPLMSPP